MNLFEQQALDLQEKHLKISPAFLCVKLKVNEQTANDLCRYIWQEQHMEAFYLRRFGTSRKEYLDAI